MTLRTVLASLAEGATAAEILVDGDKTHVVRHRETVDSLFANEVLPEF